MSDSTFFAPSVSGEIDYRTLLIKYMHVLLIMEGSTNFEHCDPRWAPGTERNFSQSESDELKRLDDLVCKIPF